MLKLKRSQCAACANYGSMFALLAAIIVLQNALRFSSFANSYVKDYEQLQGYETSTF